MVGDDWTRGSFNLTIEGLDANDPEVQAYLREIATATCSSCGHVVGLHVLVVERTPEGDELWRFTQGGVR